MKKLSFLKEATTLAVVSFLTFACEDDPTEESVDGDSENPSDIEQDTREGDTETDESTAEGSVNFSFNPTRVIKDISTLSAEEMDGRETGTNGNEKAMEYVAAQFEQVGLEPAGDEGSYFQYFSYPEWREKKETGNDLQRRGADRRYRL